MTNVILSTKNIDELVSDIANEVVSRIASWGVDVTQKTTQSDPEPYIYGINGLAKFLKCSTPTAQKIKNSGKVPFSQTERTIIFEKEKVLNALSNTKKRKG